MRLLSLAVLGLACLGASAPARRGLEIHWVDVEGGAATLVVTPAGESLLVDTGWPGPRDAERIARAAEAAGVARIDHLVTTHWHRDHFGGVADLLKQLPVERFYDHGFPGGEPRDVPPELKQAYRDATGGRSTLLRARDTISLRQAEAAPALSLRVVVADGLVAGETAGAEQLRECDNPEHTPLGEDTSDNARSVGFVLSFGEFQFLDLGDLTWNVEHKLVCPRNQIGTIDVYQVTHHGADNSNNPALVRAVAPRVAVVNNGPRKGGKPAVYRTLERAPGLEAVFQVHRNVETSTADNAAPEHVANDEEACAGHAIVLRVEPDARSYVVEVPSKGTKRSFKTR
jgi:beta-lactamase superfamily II metal-dependent hydrolase